MATGGHGIRFQYDYRHDTAGLPGLVSSLSPRWLRLIRTGDTITGYDSPDGASWTRIGAAHLSGLPATVNVGLFVTSPVSFQGSGNGAPTRATATFDHVTLNGTLGTDSWRSRSIGTGAREFYPTLGEGNSHRAGNAVVLSGSGDIAPAVGLAGGDTASSSLRTGLVASLIALIVVATIFFTGEFRRGLIRTTFVATPQRGRVLAAKAIVIGAVTFVAGALAAALAVPLGEHLLTANGNYVFPATTLTVARVITGSGVLLAVTAVAVLALASILRRSAGAVTAGIAVFVAPYVIGSIVSGSAGTWIFRVTPAAGFSMLGAVSRSPLVGYPYTLANGYYPLSPWAGCAVLCAYAALALVAAAVVLRRRDA
jgi:ABC-type transport system involved in multi-copper enzyme maturation permease subunit